jgi:hypothetical protein
VNLASGSQAKFPSTTDDSCYRHVATAIVQHSFSRSTRTALNWRCLALHTPPTTTAKLDNSFACVPIIETAAKERPFLLTLALYALSF